ncbi:UNVERIFIED_CONTAM: pleD [Trichonephila clavipes]
MTAAEKAMVGKILIADDVATNRIVFKVKLAAACYQPLLAGDGQSCLALAREAKPDAILLDADLGDMTGLAVLEGLRRDPATVDIPVLMLAAAADSGLRMAALRAGAEDCLTKPLDDQVLMARLRNLLRLRETAEELGHREQALQVLGLAEAPAGFDRQGLVIIVTERPEQALRLRRQLAGRSGAEVRSMGRDEVLNATAEGLAADAFVLDTDIGGAGGGLRLMSDLRTRRSARHSAMVLIGERMRPAEMAIAYDMGANAALPFDLPAEELAFRLQSLLRRKRNGDRLRDSVQDGLRLAVTDPLTGLYNRRYAQPRLAAIAERAHSGGTAFAVMVIDLDRFKTVNDQWGHAAGDTVLVEVAKRLSANLRPSDLVARIGGEEFLVALPETGTAEACQTAERLRHAIEKPPIILSGGQALQVTISIGLAVQLAASDTIPAADLVGLADRALLCAKSRGRNQVIQSCNAA